MEKYRWIMYLNTPMGDFEVIRVHNIEEAKGSLVEYGVNTGFYQDLQVSGQYGCSGRLYPYTEEDWAEAEEYAEIGCPFDHPSKLVENGPRGGVRVFNA